MDAELKSALQSLGWSRQRLADWLTVQTGDKYYKSRIDRWLAREKSSDKARCPGWPLALLRAHGLIDQAPDPE